MNINIKYSFISIHINCDAKECMYVNFNYIVICDADKMPKYCSVVGCLSNSTYKNISLIYSFIRVRTLNFYLFLYPGIGFSNQRISYWPSVLFFILLSCKSNPSMW